ncbi:MAG: hypothetical protein WC610_02225 [Patescibacteria group bacterium]
MTKKFIGFIFLFFLILASGAGAGAAEKVELNFFFSPTCPHCVKEEIFLNNLESKYPELIINRFNISERRSVDLIQNFYRKYKVGEEQWGLVPANFIGDKFFIGFNDEVGQSLDNYVAEILGKKPNQQTDFVATSAERISLPFIGQINIAEFSPLTLSIVLGTLDGFNACALLTLGILLTFLVSTGLRRRVILVGGTFILTSAVVYFLFISAWLNLFLALSNIKLITIAIGVITLAFALYMLKDYFNDIICKLCDLDEKETILSKWQKKLFTKIANITMKQLSLPVLLVGVVIVSAGVSLLELVCSFGLPLAFTKILISQRLSLPSYYFYLLIYILFYSLLLFIIFIVAVFTMRVTKVPDKYLKIVKLLSGVALLILGLIMLFKPGLLAF